MFLSFILSLGMAAVAKPMIITLIGEKWLPSVIYLQMLCFVGMLYPLHALNLSMLKVQGRSDLFLKLEIIKKCLAIPVIIIGVFWGIKALIAGMIFNSIIAYLLNSYWSGKMIGYSTLSQIRDIFPSFVVAVLMASIVFMLGTILQLSPTWILVIQLISGATIVYLFCELIQQKDFLFLKELFLEKLNDFKNSR